MSILVNADTKVIVQGLTGGQGRFYGLRNRAYGTKVVGGSAPGTTRADLVGTFPVSRAVGKVSRPPGGPATPTPSGSSATAVPPVLRQCERDACSGTGLTRCEPNGSR